MAALIECTADPSESLRLNAALALQKAPPKAVAEVMEHLLEDTSVRVRLLAAAAILATSPDSAAARSVAEEAQNDPSPRVNGAARDLLKSLETGPTQDGDSPAHGAKTWLQTRRFCCHIRWPKR